MLIFKNLSIKSLEDKKINWFINFVSIKNKFLPKKFLSKYLRKSLSEKWFKQTDAQILTFAEEDVVGHFWVHNFVRYNQIVWIIQHGLLYWFQWDLELPLLFY